MLLLSSLAAALVVQQPTTHLHLNPHAATSSRTSVLRLVDASLAVDTSAALVPAAQSSLTIWESAWDSHTLDTLVPDLFHTTMYATLGLMGAYVTQGTEAFETQQEEEEEMWAPPRSLQQQPPDDDDDFYRRGRCMCGAEESARSCSSLIYSMRGGAVQRRAVRVAG